MRNVDTLIVIGFNVSRHPSSAIDDLRPPAGSFNMDDVRRLSAHVVKLREIPKGVLVLFGLSRMWKSRTCDSVLRGADRNDLTLEDLVASTPSAKVIIEVEASQKRKASISGAASSHIVKVEASQSSGSTTRPNLFIDISETREGVLFPLPLKVLAPEGKGIMTDAAVALSMGDSSLFFGPYYATYPEGGVVKNYEFSLEEWDAPYQPTLTILNKEVFKDPTVYKIVFDQFSTPGEMVWIEALTNDQPNAKMSMLRYLIMSHSGKLLARYHVLLEFHHEQVAGLNDKLSSFDAAFSKSKAKRKERKKKIKYRTKRLDQLNAEVACLSTALNQVIALEAKKDKEILRLKASPMEFVSFFRASVGFERGLSMRQTKEEFAAVLKEISQFLPDNKMTGGAGNGKSGDLFMQGASHVVDDDVELLVVRSERVSFGPNEVVVALTIEDKADHVSCHPPQAEWLPLGTFIMAGQASVGSMGPIMLLEQRLYCHAWPLSLPGY
nr:hypothetical protein [Tanacetum cinerariifolium]